MIPAPTPHTPEGLGLYDIPPLPIFPFVPPLLAWIGVAAFLGVVWLLATRERRFKGAPLDGFSTVDDLLERLKGGSPDRRELSAASLAVKRLLARSRCGDVSSATSSEIAALAADLPDRAVAHVLLLVSELDSFTYAPTHAALRPGLVESLQRGLRSVREALTPPAGGAR